MKKRILLFGKGKMVIDEFFEHAANEYELQTTSIRVPDIMSHVQYFVPDVMIYSMQDEPDEVISSMLMIRDELKTWGVLLVLVGSWRECEKFQMSSGHMGDLVLKKPIMVRDICAEVMKALDAKENAVPTKSVEKETKTSTNVETASAEPVEIDEETLLELAGIGMEPVLEPMELEGAVSVADLLAGENADTQDDVISIEDLNHASPKKILVVDDNPMTLRIIRNQLIDDYVVGCANSGELALKYLTGVNPDLILLDYEMPGMDGAQVLKIVRSSPKTAKIPVVFLTGINDAARIKKVIDLKPQGYLLKPIEKTDLLQSIAKILG